MRIEDDDCDVEEDTLVYYEGEPFTGEVVERDAEGRMIGLVHYVGGITSGPQTHWHPNGSKKMEGTVKRGEAVGEWRSWHANGQLSEYSLFSQDGEYMRRQRWDKDGNLTVDKSYTN
ncbi:toxin-antitoxin system YwqK family antitoxin [Streptomyces angustmyceticus]|uniref:toxin-antitoxin system YwqK family antitoxin n=1 Tax=Streptomyces angustmyceticus TaxID=285578 RepID=UPI0036C0EDAC